MSYESVRNHFDTITQIPRPSGHEEKIRQHLIDRSENHGFQHLIDSVGNLIVYVIASPGYEHLDSMILQAHMDMVPGKDEGYDHDFTTDPIQTYEEDGRLHAKHTTLGADNGMAIAMIQAAVESTHHPKLELVFTVEEETGLTGAVNLDTSLLTSSKLINLDTEDEGEICVACSGGARTDAVFTLEREETMLPEQCSVVFSGFLGGHSGMDIDLGRQNPIYLMGQALLEYDGVCELISINGGEADNAIPRTCIARVAVENKDHFHAYCEEFLAKNVNTTIENEVDEVTTHSLSKKGKTITNRKEILTVQQNQPNGVLKMSELSEGLVQVSTNLGIIRTTDSDLTITHSPRSPNKDEIDALLTGIHGRYKSIGGVTKKKSEYPGRVQDPNAPLVQQVKRIYEDVLGTEVKIVDYHAGLECGAIANKFDREIQTVSFGPTIEDPHSPKERVELKTVKSTYEVLCMLLEEKE